MLRDGSVEVEDQWAGSALEALAGVARAGVPNQAIIETEARYGMPWSFYSHYESVGGVSPRCKWREHVYAKEFQFKSVARTVPDQAQNSK